MKNARKILILTNGALARNPRVVKEATTLGRAGYGVTVLGIRNHAASAKLDDQITRNAPFSHQQIDMLGSSTSWMQRAFSRFARESMKIGGPISIETLGPAHALLRRAKMCPSDLVIAHNEIAHWAGIQLLSEGRKVGADIEDWHSEDLLPENRHSRPVNLLKRIEAQLLNHTSYSTTTSSALSMALHSVYGGNQPSVITNSFPLQRNPRQRMPGNPPSIYWFSQTIGPGRGLEEFLSIWTNTKTPSRFVIQGELQSGYLGHLLARIPVERRSSVEVLSPVCPEELPNAIAQHDIGLAYEQPEIPSRNLTITNKILQYLNAGLAVLASDTEGQREVLAKLPEAGVILMNTDVSRSAALLDEMVSNPESLAARQRSARQLAESHYCWEKEEGTLLELVREALGETHR